MHRQLPAVPATIDLADLEFWLRPPAERAAAFAAIRAQPTLPFFEEPRWTGLGPGPGFYALTRHRDVAEASRRADIFSSRYGAINISDNLPLELNDYFNSMINLDPPRHRRLRRIVARAFTPRMLESVTREVERTTVALIESVRPAGSCDFAADLATKLPLQIICHMMGVPPEERVFVLRKSNAIMGGADPEYLPEPAGHSQVLLDAGRELAALARALAETKARRPGDDLISALVTANVDGERLTNDELAAFFILLLVAGNNSTGHAMSHGLHLLGQHPEQRRLLVDRFPQYGPGAVEEIVRWSSPIMWMRRTVTEDVTLAGNQLRTGDKVVMVYWSANRDETVFAEPHRFDITRDPNPHLGFGAAGPHYCLGTHLARAEIGVLFRELLHRLPDIRPVADPVYLRSDFVFGIKHLPCAFTPGLGRTR